MPIFESITSSRHDNINFRSIRSYIFHVNQFSCVLPVLFSQISCVFTTHGKNYK